MADGPFFVFRLPKSVGGGDVVLRELTVGEQDDIMRLQAAKSSSSGVDLLEASVMRSFVSFRGATVPKGLEGETFYRQLRPKVRQLIADAYGKVHNPTDDETAGFLESLEACATPPTAI